MPVEIKPTNISMTNDFKNDLITENVELNGALKYKPKKPNKFFAETSSFSDNPKCKKTQEKNRGITKNGTAINKIVEDKVPSIKIAAINKPQIMEIIHEFNLWDLYFLRAFSLTSLIIISLSYLNH